MVQIEGKLSCQLISCVPISFTLSKKNQKTFKNFVKIDHLSIITIQFWSKFGKKLLIFNNIMANISFLAIFESSQQNIKGFFSETLAFLSRGSVHPKFANLCQIELNFKYYGRRR